MVLRVEELEESGRKGKRGRNLRTEQMPNIFAFLAPVALLLPVVMPDGPVSDRDKSLDVVSLDPKDRAEQKVSSERYAPLDLDAPYTVPIQHQVRIQQRVIVRVSPRPPAVRQNLMADLSEPNAPTTRYEERKMEKCVPLANVAGVQTGSGNRLLLFLRDRRVVTASLEKSCRARDFYAGFYVEKNKDGKICVDRDKLQSRSGANCEVARMRQLVAVTE